MPCAGAEGWTKIKDGLPPEGEVFWENGGSRLDLAEPGKTYTVGLWANNETLLLATREVSFPGGSGSGSGSGGSTSWTPATCTNGVFSGCTRPGGGVCSDFGSAGLSGWDQAQQQRCATACALSNRNSFCAAAPPPGNTSTELHPVGGTLSGIDASKLAGQSVLVISAANNNGEACPSGTGVSGNHCKTVPISGNRFDSGPFVPLNSAYAVRPPQISGYTVSSSHENQVMGGASNCSGACNFTYTATTTGNPPPNPPTGNPPAGTGPTSTDVVAVAGTITGVNANGKKVEVFAPSGTGDACSFSGGGNHCKVVTIQENYFTSPRFIPVGSAYAVRPPAIDGYKAGIKSDQTKGSYEGQVMNGSQSATNCGGACDFVYTATGTSPAGEDPNDIGDCNGINVIDGAGKNVYQLTADGKTTGSLMVNKTYIATISMKNFDHTHPSFVGNTWVPGPISSDPSATNNKYYLGFPTDGSIPGTQKDQGKAQFKSEAYLKWQRSNDIVRHRILIL